MFCLLKNPLKSKNQYNEYQEIKVAIADDHKIFRDGIRMALKDRNTLK